MFGTLGAQEILFILILGLIFFGPRKLPEIGKSMGKMLAEFRKASNDFRRTIEDEVEADKLRTELAEQAARTPPPAVSSDMPVAPLETGAGETGAGETGAGEAPGPGDAPAPAQMADGQAPAAPETHAEAPGEPDAHPAVKDAAPTPDALHPPAESVSRE